jgi:hypothetical protein
MAKYDLRLQPGLISDDTRKADTGRYVDGSNVRFWEGLPEIIGGWESTTGALLTGVCRTVFQWTDGVGTLNVGFGTHSNLQALVGQASIDITPTLALPAVALGLMVAVAGQNPLTTTSGTPAVVVAQAGHPYMVGDTIVVSGAVAVGGITPNGTFAVAAVSTNSWGFNFSSNATSTIAGGGAAVIVTPQRAMAAGQINGTGGNGFGVGAWGIGGFELPSSTEYFPRTWALDTWGANLAANPRMGTIHLWTNGLATPAQPIMNAPAQVRAMLVGPKDQIFALGCNQEASGIFNPLAIRTSSIRNPTEWNTGTATTAREYILPGGGEIVGGRLCGPYILVWTSMALFVGTFVGTLDQPWRFDRIGKNCGLIGPNAMVVVGQKAVWMSPDLQFRSYTLGGQPTIIDCPIRKDMTNNIAGSQKDKIVASGCSKFGEVRFDYPDKRDGFENSRYIVVSTIDGNWWRGQMARTAMVDAGPSTSPIGVTVGGNVYTHETGVSADGAAFAWFFETGEVYMDEATTTMVRGMWPDTSEQQGAWNLTMFSRLHPNDQSARQFGPVAIAPTDDKVDIRFSGRLFRIRLSGNSLPAAGRLGVPVFDIQSSSKR